MFVSLAAGATQSAATEPTWLVPAITAAASLLGAIVGGAMTFVTTRSSNIRQEKAAEKRRKLDEIKDVSIRFIRLLSNQGYVSMRLKQRTDNIQSLANELTKSSEASGEKAQDAQVGQSMPNISTPTDAAGEEIQSAEGVAPEKKAGEEKEPVTTAEALLDELVKAMEYLSDLARGYGEIDATSKERDALIIEMSLILPAAAVRKAEKASRAQLHRDMTMYLPKDLQADVKGAVDAMLDFAADIRKQLGMGDLGPSAASKGNDLDQLIEKIVRKAVSNQQVADALLKKMAGARS